ncbi:MAG TPA: TrkH family potassium uptake protein [Stenotrophobium sp.]|nr:TrkH family potassium uptake protein [Stenotrophobium sp.]
MAAPHTPGFFGTHRYAAVQRIMGILMMLFSLTMLPPIFVDMLYENSVGSSFLLGLWITLGTGAVVWWPVRRARKELRTRDGFLITVLFWTVLSAFGAIPLYVAHQAWHSYTDALFEAVSGLTTTGATMVSHGLDQLPHALNFYRAQLHWFGGMGIIVLAVAVLPMLGIGGMQLYRAETPGPMKDSKLTPRITSTARALWVVYVLLTVACGITYWLLGMSPFDAICHAMSTLATGGFSTHDASIAWFNSLPIEIAAMVFMMLGASNFALHYTVWRYRDLRAYLRDTEFRAYLGIIAVMGVLICAPLYLSGVYPDLGTAIRKGMFQLVAYGTDAGFSTADPSDWPGYVPLLLVLATFMVSCAGGTGGGVKVVRLVLFTKQAMREMQKLVHPSAEVAIKFDGKIVSNNVVYAVGGFFSMYIGSTVLLSFLMMMTGLDPVTAFSAVAACINNAGPGLHAVNSNMANVTEFGKCVLIFAMLLGRLEIFTLLILFTPAFWRR